MGSTKLRKRPSENELPYDDGMPMESDRHVWQMILLAETLKLHWSNRSDVHIGSNMFVYFNEDQVKTRDFRGPDVFAVQGVVKRERKSYVIWKEGKPPDVVIELLSESTDQLDKTIKKEIYEQEVCVPEYFWFDPFDKNDFAGFCLVNGKYQPIALDGKGRLLSRKLNLALRPWHGTYSEIAADWLRWETIEGKLLNLPQENARETFNIALEAQRVAEEERQRADRLAAALRKMGVDPNRI